MYRRTQHRELTQGPAGIVAGGHVVGVNAAGLHVLDGQGQQLLDDGVQVGGAHPAQVSHQGKGALAHVGGGVLAALG